MDFKTIKSENNIEPLQEPLIDKTIPQRIWKRSLTSKPKISEETEYEITTESDSNTETLQYLYSQGSLKENGKINSLLYFTKLVVSPMVLGLFNYIYFSTSIEFNYFFYIANLFTVILFGLFIGLLTLLKYFKITKSKLLKMKNKNSDSLFSAKSVLFFTTNAICMLLFYKIATQVPLTMIACFQFSLPMIINSIIAKKLSKYCYFVFISYLLFLFSIIGFNTADNWTIMLTVSWIALTIFKNTFYYEFYDKLLQDKPLLLIYFIKVLYTFILSLVIIIIESKSQVFQNIAINFVLLDTYYSLLTVLYCVFYILGIILTIKTLTNIDNISLSSIIFELMIYDLVAYAFKIYGVITSFPYYIGIIILIIVEHLKLQKNNK